MSDLLARVSEHFGDRLIEARQGVDMPSLRLRPDALPDVVAWLVEDGFGFLTDMAGVDYLKFPKAQPSRFAVVYHLHDMASGRRVRVTCHVGDDLKVPSLTGRWQGADWLEREAWDQYGILFEGHPNLKRILNHHEFVGHPLRKDYPIRARQPLSENDALVDEMALRLRARGYVLPEVERDLLAGIRGSDHGVEAAPGAPSHGSRGGSPVAVAARPVGQGRLPEGADLHAELMFVNLGPSHPASHGTLRTFVALDGETIVAAVAEIGYLHRGFEKSTESQTYNACVPYTDRLNYCSAMLNNFAFCKAVEKALGLTITPRTQAIRVIIGELSRIIDHLVCIGTNLVDLGALTNFWYFFNVREKVYTIFDKLTGARLTNSYGRVGGLARDFYDGCGADILAVLTEIEAAVAEVETLVKRNRIFLERVQDICVVPAAMALSYGWTGPNLRASGVDYDLRKAEPYDGYDTYDFETVTGTVGDTYDRIFVRFGEIGQSARIIRQALSRLPEGPVMVEAKGVSLPSKDDTYNNIEGLMNHFKLVFEGVKVPAGEVYDASEGANGELGFYIVSDGSGRPYRNRCRPPSFMSFAAFPDMIEGHMVADAIASLGSINIIAGELDR